MNSPQLKNDGASREPNMSAFFLQRPAFREHSRHSNIASFLSFLKDDVLCPLCGGIRDSCGDRAAGCRVLETGYHDTRGRLPFLSKSQLLPLVYFFRRKRRRVHQFGGLWLVGSLGLHCHFLHLTLQVTQRTLQVTAGPCRIRAAADSRRRRSGIHFAPFFLTLTLAAGARALVFGAVASPKIDDRPWWHCSRKHSLPCPANLLFTSTWFRSSNLETIAARGA